MAPGGCMALQCLKHMSRAGVLGMPGAALSARMHVRAQDAVAGRRMQVL